MRRIAFITLAAAAVVACSTETSTAPNTSALTIDAGAFGSALTLAGGYEPDLYQDRLTNALPDSLKLTSEQQSEDQGSHRCLQCGDKSRSRRPRSTSRKSPRPRQIANDRRRLPRKAPCKRGRDNGAPRGSAGKAEI
jgi:hypothetical protein